MSDSPSAYEILDDRNVSILVVDDNSVDRFMITTACSRLHATPDMASTGEEALAKFIEKRHRLVITDYVMDPMDGLELAQKLREIEPTVEIIFISGAPSAEVIAYVQAHDLSPVITKPISPSLLINAALLSLERKRGRRDLLGSVALSNRMDTCLPLIGRSEACRQIRKKITELLPTRTPLFISGALGVGKEEIAHLLHGEGPYGDSRYLEVCCANESDEKLAQLIIAEDGALSEMIRRPDTGSLMLHNIEALPMVLQKALALEFNKFVSQIHLLVMSDVSLDDLLDAGQIDEGLYFKLSLKVLALPPLCKRAEDIPDMVRYIFNEPKKFNLSAAHLDVTAFLNSPQLGSVSTNLRTLVDGAREFSNS
jgi:DNA-binding NtrC family response regulator